MSPFMFIADLHLEAATLEASRLTVQWILTEHERIRPNHVFFLGDTVHQRRGEFLALLALKQLVDALVNQDFPCTVHLIVGNHCLNSLHDRTHSAPALIAQPKANIHAYTEVEKKVIDGVPILFIPWHEKAEEIIPFLRDHAASPDAEDMLVLGHLALRGARMTGYSFGDHTGEVLDESAVLGPAHFAPFKDCFLGHFHEHHSRGNCTYVGAPRMMSFSDVNSADRGYILYNPETRKGDLKINPHAIGFADVRCNEVISGTLDQEKIKDKSVRLLTDEKTTVHEEAQARAALRQCDIAALKVVRRVRKQNVPAPQQRSDEQARPVEDQGDFLKRMTQLFVDSLDNSVQTETRFNALAYINSIIRNIGNGTSRTLFDADITTVRAVNFLGIHGEKTFRFDALDPGVWMLMGENGAGKSQIIDAIAWCLFKETFRDVTKEEIVNNDAPTGAECSVTVVFANGVTVRRTPKALRVTRASGVVVEKGSLKHTQEILENEILNCGWETFKRTVLLDSNDFLSLFSGGDKQRNVVLERLLGMEILDTLWKTVDEDAETIGKSQAELSAEVLKLEVLLEAGVAEIQHDESRLIAEKEKLQATQAALSHETALHAHDSAAQASASECRDGTKQAVQALRSELDNLTTPLNEALQAAAAARSQLNAAEVMQNEVDNELRSVSEKLDAANAKVPLIQQEKAAANAEYLVEQRAQANLKEELRIEESAGDTLKSHYAQCKKDVSDARRALSNYQTETLLLLENLATAEREELTHLAQRRRELAAAQSREQDALRAKEASRVEERRKRKMQEEKARRDADEARKAKDEYRTRLEEFRTRQRKADEIRDGLKARRDRLAIPRIVEKAREHAEASGVERTIAGIRADVVEPLTQMHSEIGEVSVVSAKADEELLIKLERNLSRLSIRGPPNPENLKELEKLSDRAEEVWSAARTQLDEATEAPVGGELLMGTAEVSAIQEHMDELSQRISDIEAEEKQRRKDELGILAQTVGALLAEESKAQLVLSAWEERCLALRRELRAKREACAQLAERQADYDLQLAVSEESARHLQTHLSSVSSRKISDDALAGLRDQVEEAEAEKVTLEERQATIQGELSARLQTLEAGEVELEQCRARLVERTATMARLEAEVNHVERALVELTDDILTRKRDLENLKSRHDERRTRLTEEERKHEIRQLWKNALATANDTSAKSKTVTLRKGAFRQMCRREHLSFLQTRFDENLAFLNGGNWDPRLSCQLTENFQFTRRDGETTAFSQRSSGERQRTIIALLFTITEALITHGTMRPMLLIVDEITSFLDQIGRSSVFRFLNEFTTRHPAHRVIVISHGDDPSANVGTIHVTADGPTRLRRYRATTQDGRGVDFAT